MAARKAPGICERHSKQCASLHGRRCSCSPSFEAWVYSRRDGRKIRRTFHSRADAKAWRHDALVALRKGALRSTARLTLKQASDEWLEGARDGTIRDRSGDAYKPSTLRGYEAAFRLRIVPDLGAFRVSDLRPRDVQDFADRLLAQGMDPSTVRNAVVPLRALYRRYVARGEVATNPTTGVSLPAVRGVRDRIAAPKEAKKLIGALLPKDQAVWATAFYAGLRAGELRALRCEDVDLAEGFIRVRRSWDPLAGPVEPKSRAGRRDVPITAVLRDYLVAHRMRTDRDAGLFFGTAAGSPLDLKELRARADTAWSKAGLDRITLHEARHSYASMMIAAGVNAKSIQTYMGHSSITVTYDRYGHLFPGNLDEAAGLLDAYLARAASPDQASDELDVEAAELAATAG
jgi:integrase